MLTSSARVRIERERAHGLRILRRAETVWGWSGAAGGLRVARRLRFLAETLRKAPEPWLEIGCGSGVFTRGLLDAPRRVSVDVSRAHLGRLKAAVPRCACVQTDAHCLPFPSETFGAVYGVSVLHHLRYASALREIHRVLKPDGVLAFSEPNALNPLVFVQKTIPFLKRWLGDVSHETAFFRGWLFEDLARAGFAEISIDPFDFVHPALPSRLCGVWDRVGRVLERVPGIRELAGSLRVHAVRSDRDRRSPQPA